MEDEDSRTMTKFMQMMNDLQSRNQKHIDFGDNVFQYNDYTTTQAPIDLFPAHDDSWSIIWYIASFSGLIAFFLIVSCSEWCCRLHVRNASQTASSNTLRPSAASLSSHTASYQIQEQPPPAYDLFAPPSYDSVNKSVAGAAQHSSEKREFDVYVVPVHTINALQSQTRLDDDATGRSPEAALHVVAVVEDEPPSYISVQMNAHRQNSSDS